MTEQEQRASSFVESHRKLFIELGATLIVLGLVATAVGLTTNFVTIVSIAELLLVAGGIRLIFGFSARDWVRPPQLAWPGAMCFLVSAAAFVNPELEPQLMFAAVLVGVGLSRLIGASLWRIPFGELFRVGGIVSMLLGVLVWIAWPVSGPWFVAVCIGIDLITEGVSWLKLSIGTRARAPTLR